MTTENHTMSSDSRETSEPSKPGAPQWAFEHARAWLQRGTKAPVVEQQLVAGGLSAAVAATVVIEVQREGPLLRPGGSPGGPVMSKSGWDTSDPTDPTALPAWAVEKARACLLLGMRVPEIQQQLVARGLSPSAAEAVTTRVLSGYVRAGTEPLKHHTPTQSTERLLALLVAAICVLLGLINGGTPSALVTGVLTLFALWRIWCRTGWTRWVGWFILIVYCLAQL